MASGNILFGSCVSCTCAILRWRSPLNGGCMFESDARRVTLHSYCLLSLQAYAAHHEISYCQSSGLHCHMNEYYIPTALLPVCRDTTDLVVYCDRSLRQWPIGRIDLTLCTCLYITTCMTLSRIWWQFDLRYSYPTRGPVSQWKQLVYHVGETVGEWPSHIVALPSNIVWTCGGRRPSDIVSKHQTCCILYGPAR